MKYEYDLIVIGAGSGGLVVAAGSATLGAKVLLVENHLMGGDCLNYGCVPSKSLLHAAHSSKIQNKYGTHIKSKEVNIRQVVDYVQSVIDSIAPHDSVERFEGLGVKVVLGSGKLVDEHTVEVANHQYQSKSIVIATGSQANVPGIPGLSNCEYYTNYNIFKISQQPKRLIVLGAGPIGLELGQAFCHLGSEVVVVDRNERLFAKDEPEVSQIMINRLSEDGIELMFNAAIKEVKQSEGITKVIIEKDDQIIEVEGDALLVSLGRRPVLEGLNIEAVGVQTTKYGYVEVNESMQTSVKNIYACGDVVGPYQFTHMASYQAAIVIQNALFGMSKEVDYRSVVWCTYTKPEVAHVGLSEREAIEKDANHEVIFVPMRENDRARAEDEDTGFLKIIVDKKGQILGATIVAGNAGELIAVMALCVHTRQKISSFYDLILPYPTQAEIFKTAASKYRKSHVTKWQLDLLKKVIRWKN